MFPTSIPLWLDSPYSARPNLSDNISTDIAIIGGGITGICTGIQLQNKGVQPVIIERNTIGAGATGRNAGFIIAGSAEYYHRVVELVGRKHAKRLWELAEGSHSLLQSWIDEWDVECDYEQGGSLVLAQSAHEMDEINLAVRLLQDDGFRVESVSAGELSEFGSCLHDFYGGYFAPGDGCLNPVQLVRELARIFIDRGGKIFEHSEVLSVSEKHSQCVTLETEQGHISCQITLLAMNGFTPALNGILEGKVLAVRGQVLATEPTQSMIKIPCYANFGYDYFRQLPDGRLLVGGSRDHQPDRETGYTENVTSPIQQKLDEYLHNLGQREQTPSVTHRWAGIMGFSRDGLPIVGRLPYSNNVYVAAGFTGHGLSLAPKMAEIVSLLLVEGKHPDFSLFSIRRFLH